MRNWNILKNRVKEIRVNQIRVKRGVCDFVSFINLNSKNIKLSNWLKPAQISDSHKKEPTERTLFESL